MINIEIVYTLPEKPTVIPLQIAENTSILSAINRSGILEQCQIDLKKHSVGIYGKVVALDAILQNNDRIEIYRPLLADPKEIRKRRAKEQK
ncbi:MAG: RnfH family protein [Candidatus Schmidhempelia sp.]|nr:RnfH family protein [Candidatus Schmidhempelia sp.]